MTDRELHFQLLGQMALKRVALTQRLREKSPQFQHFIEFWQVAVEMSSLLAKLGQREPAKQGLVLLFESWCEWVRGNNYDYNLREKLRDFLPDALRELEQLDFVRLSSGEHFHLFYQMARLERPQLKISS